MTVFGPRTGRAGSRAYALGFFLLCSAAGIEPLAAQDDAEGARRSCVSISLPPDHWVGPALLRMQAAGALGSYLAIQRSVPLCTAHEELLRAAAELEDARVADLATNLLVRLEREFPALRSFRADEGSGQVISASLSGQVTERNGVGGPGRAEFEPDRTGVEAIEDLRRLQMEADLGLFANDRLAFRAVPVVDRDRVWFETLEGVVGLGPIALTVGRGMVGYGTATSGGIVLDQGRFDRIQLETPRSLRSPGILRPLGRFTFSTFAARLREERHANKPLFWGASASIQPHWRTTFSVHRGAMIRVDGTEFPITLRNVLSLLVGDVGGGGFENQIVSVEGRFHLPTEAVLPLTAYMEWGAEDAAGAWWAVPARVIGVQVPYLPGFAGASGGVERSSFAPSCCGNPKWYRHWSFPGAWASADAPLGHPIGGQGTEWLAYAGLDLAGSASRVDVEAFHRTRAGENLFIPGREGSSWGMKSALRWQIGGRPEIFGSLDVERGRGWREHRLDLGGRITMGSQ